MKAVFTTGGKQYYVAEGDVIYVEKLPNEAGSEVTFTEVLAVGDKIGTPFVEGAKVVCEVEKPLVKGDKVIVFKKKRRKGYRRKNGHRQYFSKVVIKDIVA